jgi:hypothetical protein
MDKYLYIHDAGFNVMNTAQPNASPTIPPGMLQTIAEAICDRPADTATKRAMRSRVVVETVQGFRPRDAVEVMLAGMAVTHVHLVEDSVRDVFRCQDDRLKARTKSTIVALDRGMFGFLKELRTAQARWRKTEAAVQAEPEAIASVDTSPVPDGQLNNAAVGAAKPATRSPKTGAVATAPPTMPEGLLPPLRRAETSVAAATAVLSPPKPPYRVAAAAKQPAAAPPPPFHVGLPAPSALAEQRRAMPPKTSGAASDVHAAAERRTTAEAAQAA